MILTYQSISKDVLYHIILSFVTKLDCIFQDTLNINTKSRNILLEFHIHKISLSNLYILNKNNQCNINDKLNNRNMAMIQGFCHSKWENKKRSVPHPPELKTQE